jgi:hypothetical protein
VLLHRSTRLSSNSYSQKRNKNKEFCTKKKHIQKEKTLKCQKVEAGYSNRIGTEKADRALHEGVPAVYVHHRCWYLPCVTFFLYSEEKMQRSLTRPQQKLAILFLAATEKGERRPRGCNKTLQSSFSKLRKREKDDRGFATARSSMNRGRASIKKRHYYKHTHT